MLCEYCDLLARFFVCRFDGKFVNACHECAVDSEIPLDEWDRLPVTLEVAA
jgi:hypothetical protein